MDYTAIVDPVPFPYREHFTEDEFKLIRAGHSSRDMNHKWVIRFEDPYLNFYRSWTGLGIYRVKLAKVVAGYDVVEAICEAKMLVNNTPEEQAELLKFLVGNLLPGRELPFPNPHNVAPEYPGLYQHAIVGTGYPEKKG